MDFSGIEGHFGSGEQDRRQSQSSYIDPESEIDGVFKTEHDLRVEGKMSGTIRCEGVLIVAEGALVDAEIDASSIVVAGEMSGTIRCRGRLEIRSSGIVRGDVKTGALVIHEGARYEGQIAMEPSSNEDESVQLETEEGVATESEHSNGEYSFLRRFAPDEDDAELDRDDEE